MFAGQIKEQMDLQLKNYGYECSPKCCAAMSLSVITGAALFIIGCIGAAGAFPGSSIGWVTVGLAGGTFILTNLASNKFKERKFELISSALITAILVTVGVLGGVGILSSTQVGWGIVGTTLASMPVSFAISLISKKKINENNLNTVGTAPAPKGAGFF
jgi:hypothetical protein